MEEIQEKHTLITRFKSFLKECKRVFMITKKPSIKEFKAIVKVTGIGILVIGVLGFLIQILWILIKK